MGNLITTFDKTSIDTIATYRANAGGRTRIYTERVSTSATGSPFSATESPTMFFLQTYVTNDINTPVFQIASGTNGQIRRRFQIGTGNTENWSNWTDLKGDTGTCLNNTGLTVGSSTSTTPATSNLFGPLNVSGDVTVGTTSQNRNATFNGNLTYKILTNATDINVSSDFEIFLDPQIYSLQSDGATVTTPWRSSVNNYSFSAFNDVKFFKTGGINNGPYIKLNNPTSPASSITTGAYLDGGSINLNNLRTTGFTIIMIYRYNTSTFVQDRFIDFGSGNNNQSGNLVMRRSPNSSDVYGGYINAGAGFVNPNPIVDFARNGSWNIYAVRYTPTSTSGNIAFFRDGIQIGVESAANLSTVNFNFANSLIGKSNWTDSYSHMDIGGFFISKRPLSQTEISNYSNFNNTNFTTSDGTFMNNLNVGGNLNLNNNLNVGGISRNNNPSWSLYMDGMSNITEPATVTYNRNAITPNNVNVNLSTGIVTITVSGRYYISFSAFSHNNVVAGEYTTFELRKNNTSVPPIRSFSHHQADSKFIAINPITVILDLAVGDTVSIYLNRGSLHGNQNCYFSGYMIS